MDFLQQNDQTQQKYSNLIVRVKRKRNSAYVEQLTVESSSVESNSLIGKLSKLSTQGDHKEEKRIILQRVTSGLPIDDSSQEIIDRNTINSVKKARTITEFSSRQSDLSSSANEILSSSAWVTTNKRNYVEESRSYCLVDVSCVDIKNQLL